jgi:hypothetical protein
MLSCCYRYEIYSYLYAYYTVHAITYVVLTVKPVHMQAIIDMHSRPPTGPTDKTLKKMEKL